MDKIIEPIAIRVDELPSILYAIVKQQSGVRIPAQSLNDIQGKTVNLLAYRDEGDLVFEAQDSITIH